MRPVIFIYIENMYNRVSIRLVVLVTWCLYRICSPIRISWIPMDGTFQFLLLLATVIIPITKANQMV